MNDSEGTQLNPREILEQSDQLFLAGDWHADFTWGSQMLKKMIQHNPDVKAVVQLGDFGLFPTERRRMWLLQKVLQSNGMHLFVILGNHEDYDLYERLLQTHSDADGIVTMPEWNRIHVLPKVFHWNFPNGLKALALGGANSINRDDLVLRNYPKQRKSWWAQEQISDADVLEAQSVGKLHAIFSHEAPFDSVPNLDASLWTPDGVSYAEESAMQMELVVDSTGPQKLFHGHYHKNHATQYGSTLVRGLHMNGHRGNVGLYDSVQDSYTEIF